MTRDQMHNTLRYVREQLAEERGSDFSGVKALDLVLEELEQEPTDDYFRRMAGVVISQLRTDRDRLEDKLAELEQKPSGDLISRQAVLDLAKKGVLVSNGNYKSVCKAINELPSVNPQEQKTGHREYNDIYDHYLCGNCKTVVMDYDNYCPNCGAKMIEPQETETWNGIHAQITAPKGTFERIFNEADDDNDI